MWDSFLKDGKITKEDREKAAQYADEAGRTKRKRDGREDMTGERKKAKCAPVKPEACLDPDDLEKDDTTNEARPSVMHQEKPTVSQFCDPLKPTVPQFRGPLVFTSAPASMDPEKWLKQHVPDRNKESFTQLRTMDRCTYIHV